MAINQKITGRVIDYRNSKGLNGVAVSLGDFKTTTKNGGNYSLQIIAEEIPSDIISFQLSKYEPQDAPALKLDGTLKNRINIVKLDSLERSLEKEVSKLIVMDDSTINQLNSFNIKSAEAVVTETINNEVNKINERLIPYSLKLLANFGITSLSQTPNKTCPPLNQLSSVVAKKNKLTRQLNNILKTTGRVSTVSTILKALLLAFKLARKLITINPIPSTIGLPPGPAGGVILSTSLGKISVIEDKKDKLTKLIDRFGNVIAILEPSTIPLVASLTKVLDVLGTTDVLLGECLDEARQIVVDEINTQEEIEKILTNGVAIQPGNLTISDTDFSNIDGSRLRRILGISPNADFNIRDLLSGTYLQVQLDEELTNITKEEAESGSPIVTEYKGFTLAVETQDTETNLDIKRRYAVGKDSKGIVVVKGEPSFASSDQILINELIFTIDKNDLKPN
tara:strand:- start:160 stop:1515 length:1356 start_codon:yes stop_codon:yes gene_type:complete